jgi:hypothetical protein
VSLCVFIALPARNNVAIKEAEGYIYFNFLVRMMDADEVNETGLFYGWLEDLLSRVLVT